MKESKRLPRRTRKKIEITLKNNMRRSGIYEKVCSCKIDPEGKMVLIYKHAGEPVTKVKGASWLWRN